MNDSLWEFIRTERTVLFAGAGMSIYAGYPSGVELRDQLYLGLSPEEQTEVPAHVALADLTDMIVRRDGSTAKLYSQLEKIYRKRPISTNTHDMLAKLPHFRTIITTNYDPLFENALGNQAVTYIEEADLLHDQPGCREIFKLHGDFTRPNSIILTRSQYTAFHGEQTATNLMWTNVKARITNQAILFIGYSLEDLNVELVIDEMSRRLKEVRRPMFLVAPKFSKVKQSYVAERNITYIDMKGEVFIEQVSRRIYKEIMADYRANRVSLPTVEEFCRLNGVQFDTIRRDGKAIPTNFQGVKDNLAIELRFSPTEQRIQGLLKKMTRGKLFDPIILNEGSFSDFQILGSNIDLTYDIPDELRITVQPTKTGTAQLIFTGGFQAMQVAYTIFIRKLVQVELSYHNLSVKIRFPLKQGKINAQFNFQVKGAFDTSQVALDVYQLVSHLSVGTAATVFFAEEKQRFQLPQAKLTSKSLLKEVQGLVDFYSRIQHVENFYQQYFTQLSLPTPTLQKKLELLEATMEGRVVDEKYDGELSVAFDANADNQATMRNLQAGKMIEMELSKPEQITMFGKIVFDGTIHYTLHNLYLLQEKKVGDEIELTLKSKSKTRRLRFERHP